MDKVLVVVFHNEENAREGAHFLDELHYEGTITVYASAIIKKNIDGTMETVKEQDQGPIGTGVGVLAGSLIGMLGGPVGVAVGAYVGTLGGMVYDLAKAGVNDDFIDEVGEYLLPGRFALIAEMYEERVFPVDNRMAQLNGVVFRRFRGDVLDYQIERDAAAFRAEISDLESEIKTANAEAKASLQTKLDNAKAKLKATRENAKEALENEKRETEAKIDSLKQQISKANAETKAKLEKRIEEIKAEHKARTERLNLAWENAKLATAF